MNNHEHVADIPAPSARELLDFNSVPNMSNGGTELDLCRACLRCGQDDHPQLMKVWRDADGEGHWIHPWCGEAINAELT